MCSTHKRALAVAFVFSISGSLQAETLHTDDVVVTAARIPQPREAVLADVTVIDNTEIQRAGQSTLTELLQTQPGIEISNTGGAGQISRIFIRGTNSSHVVVLIDGMRISNATFGTTAFENLPTSQIDRIEILRGAATSLYGADAIGGVIQIFTKKGSGAPSFSAAAGYGSYNTRTAEAGVNGSIGDTRFSLNASSYETDGFSAYRTTNPQFSDDDGYQNLAISASLNHQIALGHTLGMQLYQSRGETNFDQRFNATDFSDHANLEQRSYAVTSTNQWTARWLSTLRIGEGVDELENFAEVSFFNPVSRSYFGSKQRQYSWQHEVKAGVGTLFLLYDRLEQKLTSTTNYDKTRRDNDGYVIGYLTTLGNHSLQANYRSDHNSQFGTHSTGNLSYGYRIDPQWQLVANHGTAFKAPGFTDLYFPGFSNPDLKPEKSRNSELGIRYRGQSGEASLTLYENRIKDLIGLDFSTAPFVFNISEARIRGLTLSGSQYWGAWEAKGSLDVQSPRDEDTGNLLPRRANRHASANLNRAWGDWRIGTEVIASGSRYNDAANTQRLGGYTLLNLTLDYLVAQDWKLQARVNNLFNKEYALAYDGNPATGGFAYDTPGANVFIGVRYQPK